MTNTNNGMNREALGPAERIIQTALAYSDHMVHNRPGIVRADPASVTGVRWSPGIHRNEETAAGKARVMYEIAKVPAGRGKSKSHRTRVGVIQADGRILENGAVIGRYQPAGLFPEVATWLYKQVAEVWKLDNEFAARWASYAFAQEHRDLKTVLAAFMLVQSRSGAPVLENGKLAFSDADYRGIGEAMILLYDGKGKDLTPKLLVRIEEILKLPGVAEINRTLGFGRSARNPALGRYDKAVQQWLAFREDNPKLLTGLVKAGFRTTVIDLAKRVGFKPSTPRFFDILRWKQAQSKDGHRHLAIGQAVKAAETWEGLTEAQVCERIVREKPSFKLLASRVPTSVGITRAVMAAAIEAGSLSNKDLIIATPTLEDLGLLEVQMVKERWQRAVQQAEDQRAANIARNVKSKEVKEQLQDAADTAVKKAVEEVMKDMRVYFFVDISGSMHQALPTAVRYVTQFLQGFPGDKLHIAVFNTAGREVTLPRASAAGVEAAFRGISAGGGTDYGSGVRALGHRRPKDGEDVLFIFVGDEQQDMTFTQEVRRTRFDPLAFGFIRVVGTDGTHRTAVQRTAAELSIPCFMIDERTFSDPYAIPRTIRALVAATPVGRATTAVATPRQTLVDTIMKTELLRKPAWTVA